MMNLCAPCRGKKLPKQVSVQMVDEEQKDGSKINFSLVKDNDGDFTESYQMGPCIGKGTYGEVRLCFHKISKQQRAVRIVKKSSLDTQAFNDFQTERLLLQTLDHPNILKLYETFQDKKRFFLVTEYLQGGELFHQIENHANCGTLFTEEETATITDQICKALRYLHQNKIMLMDLKPENILFESKTGVLIKLIDFNLARTSLGNLSVPLLGQPLPSALNEDPLEVLGTSYYIAPEVLERNYDESCDIWSLGVIMYLMLTGVPPFNGEDDEEILAKVRTGKYSIETLIDAGASDEAIDLLTKMMEVDRHKRITAEQAQQHPWITKNIRKETAKVEETNIALTNLRSFKLTKKLQEAAIQFMVNNIASREELRELQLSFDALDTSGDGQIGMEELVAAFKAFSPDARREVEEIFREVDLDKNGQIEFSEWVVASIDKRQLLTDEKLRVAFSLFDKDGGGSISPEEVKATLVGNNSNIDSEVWNQIIAEVDVDGSGEIDFAEFSLMMRNIVAGH